MRSWSAVIGGVVAAGVLAGCTPSSLTTLTASLTPAPAARSAAADAPPLLAYAATPRRAGNADLDRLIARAADRHDIPETLIRRVIVRESGYNQRARNGQYWGLMQISYATARSMGYRGAPEGLLDPATNLEYAGKYLRGAYLVADRSEARAVRLYASGYYYVARDRGMLEQAGLR